MKYWLGLICLLSFEIHAFEYEVQLENDEVCVSHAKIMPRKEIGLHRDGKPQVIIALQGGILTRLEADGTTNEIHFPSGKAVYRKADPPNQFHKSVNNSSHPLELIIIQLKGDQQGHD